MVSQTSGVQHPKVLCQGEEHMLLALACSLFSPSASLRHLFTSSLLHESLPILASHINPAGQDGPPDCLVVGMLLNLQRCSYTSSPEQSICSCYIFVVYRAITYHIQTIIHLREFCKARGNKREFNTALLKWNLPKTYRKMDLIRAANGEQFVPVI